VHDEARQTTPSKLDQHWVPAGQLTPEQPVGKPPSGKAQVAWLQIHPVGQASPQPPQLAGSLSTRVHPVGQQLPEAVPVEQLVPTLLAEQLTAASQKPNKQSWPASQARPQPPQLAESLVRSSQIDPQQVSSV
jgi:hypothetical protein